MASLTALTAFALSPGWWIVIIVAILLIVGLAVANYSKRGSGVTSRRYRSRMHIDS